ncbi:hypothetical protein [Streptomyces sp. NPDC001851]|uniref:hypothetical protein n=1 Tax=Streptomyces sp. NPDC001851 TaxID=3154529 RepID=UPI003317CFA0
MFGTMCRKHLSAVGATAVLLAALTACGGGGGDDAPDPVHGLKDTVRHIPRKTTRATRPHLVKHCTTGTHRTCRKVQDGTETYRRELRPERWCVRLDDVDGDRKRNDVWYRVDRTDYDRVVDAGDRARVEFVPLLPDNGC